MYLVIEYRYILYGDIQYICMYICMLYSIYSTVHTYSTTLCYCFRAEWSGVEWSGVEWSGVEWSGGEWRRVEESGGEWRRVEKSRLD